MGHHVAMEFLVDMVTTVPAGMSDDDVADMRGREAADDPYQEGRTRIH